MNKKDVIKTVERNLDSSLRILKELIKFPSTRGNEKDISRYLKKEICRYVDSTGLMIVPESITRDPDYSFKIKGFRYGGTANLRVKLRGKGKGKTIAFNSHLDVVPPSAGQDHAFSPRLRDNKIFGRGACDCKGQIATLWLMLKSLHELKLSPFGEVVVDFVVEEECGGNGTLLALKNGLRADAAIVMEPTDLQVVHLVRGAVWFEVTTRGKAGHSGSPASTKSALKEAIKVMGAIEDVREKLLLISRKKVREIAHHPNPMPCTFGMLHSGNWPAAAPSEAVLKGVFGFLPPFRRKEVQKELKKALNKFQTVMKFNMLNNDPSFLRKGHPLVQRMLEAAREAGIESKPEFMNASCDAWRYSQQAKIPAIVFGAGSITSAHAKDEHIDIDDIKKAALALIYFIDRWSGLAHG
jgi:acetylornithine deacetylase